MARRKADIDNAKYFIEYGVDLKGRKIMLDEDIEDFSIGFVMRSIMQMIEDNNEKPIDIYINSYGGSVYDGLALCDLIEDLEVEVRTHAQGKIMSMALLIFACGDKRFAQERASFMAHSLSSGTEGKVYEQKVDVIEADRLNKILLKILADRSDKTEAWWKKQIEYKDMYFEKTKAIELGLVTDE